MTLAQFRSTLATASDYGDPTRNCEHGLGSLAHYGDLGAQRVAG